ncbi:MAG: nucleotidyltransferase domain-containing protein [Candidatus Micrarchaeota archaeon]
MVQKTNLNLAIVKKFRQKIAKIVDIREMLFFGSRAQGNFREDSDFDLIVVSKDFEQKPFYKRSIALYAAWKEQYPLELLCYTEKEFREKKDNFYGIIAKAAKTGIRIV